MACAVYVSVACVMVFPFRVAAPVVVALVVGTIALGAREDWGSQVGTAFGIMAASVAVFGLRAVMTRNIDLVNAQLGERPPRRRQRAHPLRPRPARHPRPLAHRDHGEGRARPEAPRRRRRAGPRRDRRPRAAQPRRARPTYAARWRATATSRCPGELVRARVALRAAEIDAELPNSTDDVPSELRELFAWTVREGVTNVIRHSGARPGARSG